MKKLKTMLIVGVIGAVVATVAKRLQGGGKETTWQSGQPPA